MSCILMSVYIRLIIYYCWVFLYQFQKWWIQIILLYQKWWIKMNNIASAIWRHRHRIVTEDALLFLIFCLLFDFPSVDTSTIDLKVETSTHCTEWSQSNIFRKSDLRYSPLNFSPIRYTPSVRDVESPRYKHREGKSIFLTQGVTITLQRGGNLV